ncbi:AAA family ATPase [Anaerotruncus colihominis]|uniref:AAA family ATPase n=1 Tax=Anaerotruncus colihominis TaxID=169435 RepID=UPI0018AC5971|nr:AAA family ATPase [Anaerotruncus colihominis]
MIRILHTADIHLGDLNGPTKDGKNLRRLDTLACMDAIVQQARAEGPHVSIIAGDLFNRSRVWADTALEDVNDAVSRFIRPLCQASDAVVLLFGTENHDNPLAFETLTEITKDEKNLHIYTKPTVESIGTSEGPVQIMAVPGFDKGRLRLFCPGADKEAENRNATALINDVVIGLATQLDHSKPAVMVAHYTVSGAEADNGSTFLAGQDVVILPATIDAAGVDLACFGHIHRPQRLTSNTPAYYCGSPNQLNFNDEATEHGFYIHELPAAPVHIPGNVPPVPSVVSRFVNTPERRHYTYRMGADDVAAFIQAGELTSITASFTGAIVRVRYCCNAEQEKAFNRAELQKRLMAAGAFHVAEILPEEIEELDARDPLTEHDGPAETLARWMEVNEITGADADRLMELAAPIIKQADDGRDADKHTGAFVPLNVEVKNYRSYTEATFDFSPVHMAMVNGQNGVGKSSLFMDAIADCLYEQTRKEDVGGWVRDGTKSGAITFTFGMGGQQYRVIRTRTKSGRGTLALHRLNPETGAWEDESDTTMRLTQTKIERLLGMDCNTFCSIALIRQDAYGLFLEADSDRRMEVLSALLGLDIYGRMEEGAKAAATEQRRKIAATKERINILGEQISQKDVLQEEDARIVEKTEEFETALKSTEEAIAATEQAEAMKQELAAQAAEKDAQAGSFARQADEKTRQAVELTGQLNRAKTLAAGADMAAAAADAVKGSRAELEALAPVEEKYRTLRVELGNTQKSAQEAAGRLQMLQAGKVTASEIVSQKAEIEAAQRAIEELSPVRAAALARLDEKNAAATVLHDAESAVKDFLTASRSRINALAERVKTTQAEADRLKGSGCPAPETATCLFLLSACEASANLPTLEKELADMKAADRSSYDELKATADRARDAYEAIGDPYKDIRELDAKEREHRAIADLAPKLAAAEAQIAEIDRNIAETQATADAAQQRVREITGELLAMDAAIKRADALRATIKAQEPLADTLGECRAAAATVAALEPQIQELYREAGELEEKRKEAVRAANDILARIPTETVNLSGLRAIRDGHRKTLNDFATQRGAIRAKLETIAEAEAQTVELRKETQAIAATLNDYTTLVQAFGLEGIQYMIIRGVVPEIMRQSNDILAAMTGGRMAVDIRTEREQKSTKQIVNSLEVWISSIAGTNRPYQSHSGGEKVKISLAVTLGLADVKARRAGVQLGMLFIDEPPFLDADGTEAYADALTNMAARNPGMRILAISHDPTMKARFSQNIVVTAGENGSSVTME